MILKLTYTLDTQEQASAQAILKMMLAALCAQYDAFVYVLCLSVVAMDAFHCKQHHSPMNEVA